MTAAQWNALLPRALAAVRETNPDRTVVARYDLGIGASWAYWEFGTDFGVYDPRRDAWQESLRHALLGSG